LTHILVGFFDLVNPSQKKTGVHSSVMGLHHSDQGVTC